METVFEIVSKWGALSENVNFIPTAVTDVSLLFLGLGSARGEALLGADKK